MFIGCDNMWDTNQNWQSDEYRKMLIYERDNCREKFIYDVNQILNMYYQLLFYNNLNAMYYLIDYDDPQLVSFIFSLISITHNKDELSNYIHNADLRDYMQSMININGDLGAFYTHSFSRMPEKNLNIGESFEIPHSTLSIYNIDKNKWEFNIEDWNFSYDPTFVSIENGIITSENKGVTIIECINKNNSEIRRIKINNGNIKQSNITEFFFTQIRNVIAHGKYSVINSGSYDTINEYGCFTMIPSDNRYKRGTHREMVLSEKNQLNLIYGGENSFNPKYLIFLAKTLYKKDKNSFIKYIELFDNEDDFINIKEQIKKISDSDKIDLKVLFLLSKFYINYIYNYDCYDKDNFNYEFLEFDKDIGLNLDNKMIIYEIRTSIMHGRYTYDENGFYFWNYDKKNTETISFSFKIDFDSFSKLIIQKEEIFYQNMKYDDEKLYSERKNKL